MKHSVGPRSRRSNVGVIDSVGDGFPAREESLDDRTNNIKYVKIGPAGTEAHEGTIPREIFETLDLERYMTKTRRAVQGVSGRCLSPEDTLAKFHESLSSAPVTHETMLQSIKDEGWMPSWESYHSSRASSLWLRLCNQPGGGAATYESSVSFFRALQPILYRPILEQHLSNILRHGIQISSLGIGDGVKDSIMLEALAQKGIRDVDHVLVDASILMLNRALSRFTQSNPRVLPQNLSLEARYMLFEQLRKYPVSRRIPEQIRITLLLGLTIGNFRQGKGGVFELLRDSMQPGDIFIVDYQGLNRQKSEDIRRQYDTRAWKEFVSQPLGDIVALRFNGIIPFDLLISKFLANPVQVVEVRFVDEIVSGESSGIGAVEFILTDEACVAFESFVHTYCGMPDFTLPRPFNLYRSCKYMPGAFESKLQQNGFSLSEHKISGFYGYNLLMAHRI